MNETFDLNRFWNLLKKDFRALWPRYGVSMIIMACLTLVLWLLVLLFSQWSAEGISQAEIVPLVRLALIIFGTALAACIAPFKLYGEVNDGKRGYYFALLPASKLEKYLSMLVHCLLTVPLLVLVAAVAVDTLLYLLPFGSYHEALWQIPLLNPDQLAECSYEVLRMMLFVTNPLLWVVMWLNAVVPFLFTNTIFKKNKFIKTLLWMWLIGFVFQMITTPIFISLGLTDWMQLYFDRMDDFTFDKFMLWMGFIVYGFDLLVALVLYWWTGRRLYKMKY